MDTGQIIILFSSIVHGLAFVVLASAITESSWLRYIIAFVAITLSTLFLAGTPFVMLASILILALCFTNDRKQFRCMFCTGIAAALIMNSIVLIAANPVLIIVPGWINTLYYSLFIGTIITITSLAIKLNSEVLNRYKQIYQESYVVALTLGLIILQNILFTIFFFYYVETITDEIMRLVGFFYVAIIVFVAVIGFLVNRINTVKHQALLEEMKNEALREKLEQKELYEEKIQSQFNTATHLRHYFGDMIVSISPFIRKGDMGGLQEYWDKYIMATFREQVIKIVDKLDGVKNENIRNLFETKSQQALSMENITLQLSINGIIRVPKETEMEVFEILSNFIDNALKELKDQSNGLLQITTGQSESHTVFTVGNTIRENLDIPAMFEKPDSGDGHGYGLKRVRDIIHKNPIYRLDTHREGMYEGKHILVQEFEVIYNEEAIERDRRGYISFVTRSPLADDRSAAQK